MTTSPARAPFEIATAVIERARRGDPDAFAALVRHYDPGLRALAYRLLGDRDRMDDALQETYVKAFRALPRFRGRARLGTWLYRIAYNTCMDELGRRPGADLALGEVDEPFDPAPGPPEAVARRHDLAAALDALPAPDRAAVLLVDLHGFDYRDAGEILGVAEGTVASRLHRARATLRERLGDAA